MRERKKTIQGIAVLMLLITILLLFYWYSTENSKRIERQNLNYASDTARQTVVHIDIELRNALNRVNTYAYFLGESLSEPSVKEDALHDMEQNALFDSFRYTDASGKTISSDGRSTDSSDLDYYINGMKGESGISVVLDSRLSNDTVVGFYSPVSFQDEIIGVLRGVYSADKFLRNLLTVSYFGETADAFLCLQDGTIIASSNGQKTDSHVLEYLFQTGMIDQNTAEMAGDIFQNGGEGSFICSTGSKTDNVCVMSLEEQNYILVQTFPKSVTQTMIHNANRIGIILEILLIGMFILYILFILLRTRKEKKLLEQENLEMGYVINGVNTLFSRFIMVDLEQDTYQYLAGTKPERPNFAPNGKYEDFSAYLCSFLTEENDKQKFMKRFERESIIKVLGKDNTEVRYEQHVQKDEGKEWEHLSIVCLERKEGRANKVLFLRQNITKVKERELKIQSEISVANRKERQYIVALMADAICTYEFNLTRDLLEKDILRVVDGQIISLLDKVGLKAPCSATEWFEGWKQFVSPESLDDYCEIANVEYLRKSFAEGDPEVTVEFWSGDALGNTVCVQQSFIMTWDDETEDIMVMVILKEITGQVKKQMEQTQTLRDALAQAQHANNAKTTFLSNMSHDIRTPMNAIIGFATIAASHIDNKDQVRDCLQKVLSSSNHLLSLINDILDMSRIESGKVQIKEQPCNISELTHNLVNIIQPQVKAKQMELFIDTFDIANEDVIADSLKLSQVFVNLMSNAVKYTPAGGTVSFRIMQKTTFRRGYGDYVFTVKDNGIGMSPEFVEHIFEPFEREASTTQTGIQGTGLGMAITKNIVDMMGGTITVNSEKGKGSEFIVEISLKLQDLEKNNIQIKELEGLRALVVDDDFDSCDSVNKMLKQIGMRSEWTTSGREAVYKARSAYNEGDSYHTYIIDWQMPELSGIETARRIRNIIGSEAPIIILTAYDWSDIEEEAKMAGITGFCAKPLFMSDLKSALLAANNLMEKDDPKASWTNFDFDGKRILLVEDNELNREIAVEILSETGFIVDTAPDGTDAVSMMTKAEENYYDAILMDVQMPIMDGYEATRTIRALPRKDVATLPIIAMTANAMDEDKEAALKNGMTDHIAKPINVDVFISILCKYLK